MITILSSESGGDIEVDRFVNKVLMDMDDEGFNEYQKIEVVDLLSARIFEAEVNKKTKDMDVERFVKDIPLNMDDEGLSDYQQRKIVELLSEYVLVDA